MCVLQQELKRFELIFIYITNFTIKAYKKYHFARTDFVTATFENQLIWVLPNLQFRPQNC